MANPEEIIGSLVYAAINCVTGDFYIGATEKGLRARSQKHRANALRGQAGKFYTAIRKYGIENFDFVPLSKCKDFWDALDFERVCIALMRPKYNLTEGGGGVKGLKLSDEARAKMSAAKKGKPCKWTSLPNATEIRQRLSVAASRKRNRPQTPVERAATLARVKVANVARRRTVVCLNDGKCYGSMAECAKAYGTTTGRVSYLCSGNHKSRKGWIFRHADQLS